jgi:hypothetical protein
MGGARPADVYVVPKDVLSELKGENTQKINKFAQVLCRYLLLDILSNVLDVPRHPSLQLVPSHPHTGPLVGRMQQVRACCLSPFSHLLLIDGLPGHDPTIGLDEADNDILERHGWIHRRRRHFVCTVKVDGVMLSNRAQPLSKQPLPSDERSSTRFDYEVQQVAAKCQLHFLRFMLVRPGNHSFLTLIFIY